MSLTNKKNNYYANIKNFDEFYNKWKFLETKHPFHIVDPSPWPFFSSLGIFPLAIGAVGYFHGYFWGLKLLFWSFIYLLIIIARWNYDVVIEGTFEGKHTKKVTQGLRYGVILFILSEVMFFFSFFWAFFHSSIAPSIWIGGIWPPIGIDYISPWEIPLVNTAILLTSGVTVTAAHVNVFAQERGHIGNELLKTIGLGVLFTGCQFYEYTHATFSINDGIYGSCFYVMTGFHGLHVLFGTIWLTVILVRHYFYHFTVRSHFAMEGAIWYWHFVDVVWIFLYITLYVWSQPADWM